MTSDAAAAVQPPFSANEFAGRVARLRARLCDAGVDVALFDEIEAMTWLSGYGNSENRWRCVGIPANGEPFIVIRALDAGPCRRRTWIADVRSFRDWEDPMRSLADAVASRGAGDGGIGVDLGSYCMPPRRLAQLQAALPNARLVDLGPLVAELRLLKSPAEIALLRQAAAIADEAMRRTLAASVRGSTQRAAAKTAMDAFMELGADPGPPGPISSARGWDFLHGALDGAPLSDGDVVHVELTPRVAGYSARLMRCAVVGSLPPMLLRNAEQLAQLQDRQIAAIRPGALASEVDAVLRDGVLKSGLRDTFDNITGYTLGLYSPAGPRTSDFTRSFHPEAHWRIEPNMVFHIYVSAAGISFSETVLVTENGSERLTRLPRVLVANP